MRFLSPVICSIALSALASSAFAGAWTQDPGNGLFILNGLYYSADKLWDNSGHKQSQPTYSKYELDPYLEYGLADGVTIGTNLSLQRAHQDGHLLLQHLHLHLRQAETEQSLRVLDLLPLLL